jgi:hypothetical protein
MYHSPDCAHQASDLTWLICGLQIRNRARFLSECNDTHSVPLLNLGDSGCTASAPCEACQGDCDSDDDCNSGLKCFQRNGYEQVPGCAAGGDHDVSEYDYCSEYDSEYDYYQMTGYATKCGPSVQMVIEL